MDAVVNAANRSQSTFCCGHQLTCCGLVCSSLDHASGLAGALVKAGGQAIQQESWALVKKEGKVLEGNVAVTGPGTYCILAREA